jgi:hypothetical protein
MMRRSVVGTSAHVLTCASKLGTRMQLQTHGLSLPSATIKLRSGRATIAWYETTLVAHPCFIPLFHIVVSYPCFIPVFHTFVSYLVRRPMRLPSFRCPAFGLQPEPHGKWPQVCRPASRPLATCRPSVARPPGHAWAVCRHACGSQPLCFMPLIHTLVSYPRFIPLCHTSVSHPCFMGPCREGVF